MSKEDLPPGAYVRLLVAIYLSLFLVRVAFGVVVVTFASYLAHEGDFVYSLVVTASPLLELITVIFAGVLIDRYGRKEVLLVGLGLGAFSLYALALTRHVGLLALINAVHGVAAALILVTTLALITALGRPEHRGREMGLFNLANILGWLLGFVFGYLLRDVFDGRLEYTFVLAGLAATGGLLVANRLVVLPREKLKELGIERRPSLQQLLSAVSNRQVILLTIPWLVVFMLVSSLITFLPRVTADALELSGGTTSIGILVVGGLLFASQIFWGRLTDRLGRERIMLVGAIGFALLMGVIVYAFFDTGSEDAQVIYESVMSHLPLLLVLLFTALAFAPAGLAAIADEAKEGAEGTTMSAYSLTLSLGFILGPPIVGAISARFGGRGMVAFFATLAGILVGLVVARVIHQRASRQPPPHGASR